jgi:serine/threonine-protein kinase
VLPPGTRLGQYEIQSTLGAGGMGEVYVGRDHKLHRDVAIKVLHPRLAGDPVQLTRLHREAEVLASLNHPHIAAIYGVEEAEGTQALVLELVEGETLAQRIARSRLSTEEAVSIARQIADALRAAHDRGIVHRDLKPANVKLRPDGIVKVLDFGLAKSIAPQVSSESSPTHAAESLTKPGLVVGTPAYMAPEQVAGKTADKRCDIWAFGCVLFEMLASRRPFDAADVGETFAAVLGRDPDWALLPPQVPPPLRALVRRCLARDPQRRIGDLAAAQFVFDEQAELTTDTAQTERFSARRLRLVVLGAALLAALLAGGAWWFLASSPRPRFTRLALASAPTTGPSFLDTAGVDVGMAPDGTWVAYIGNNFTQLFVRRLDTLEPTAVLTTPAYIRGVFVSADGEWLGYVENNFNLRKVPVGGGAPATIVTMDGPSRGATWSSKRGIVFASGASDTGLQHVDSAGGPVTVLTRPDHERAEADHVFPEFLPDDRHVLFTILAARGGLDAAQLAVLDLETGAWRTLLSGGYRGRFLTSGHLVYASGATLRAVAFDPSRLDVRGASVEVAPQLFTGVNGLAAFDVAQNGTLAYLNAQGGMGGIRALVWVDRKGRETALDQPGGRYHTPRIAPDGKRLVVSDGDLWLIDLDAASAQPTRLTFTPEIDWFPVWTPDSRRFVFGSWRGGGFSNLYVQSIVGGTAERLTDSADMQLPTSITPDGEYVVFHNFPVNLQRIRLEPPPHEVETLIDTAFEERNGDLSPDGRWLAYEGEQADRPGQLDVYVRPYPNTARGQWQVSSSGGMQPLWSRTGDELFFRELDGTMAVAKVETDGSGFRAEKPIRLFQGPYLTREGDLGRTYDVSPDGKRFLMLKLPASDPSIPPPHIAIVQNLDEELKRLAP